jgi:integrase/recombinase XerD
MFERLIKTPVVLERYRGAPLATERDRFLRHFEEQGHSYARLLGVNWTLMAIAIYTKWHDGEICRAEIEAAADSWLASRVRHHKTVRAGHGLKQDFVSIATQFLRFTNRLAETPPLAPPFETEMEAFLRFLDEERGLAAYTVALRRRSLELFLIWLAKRADSITAVTPRTITEYFSVGRQWNRATVKFHVNTLRSFFRFAANKGWCQPTLAATIDAPRIYTFESLPQGLKWPDVQRLITGLSGTDPADIRDRAVIMLLAIYGFRMREVITLTLDDLDWSAERINVYRSKQRKRQQFPLCAEVGEAVIRYLRDVRPRSTYRHVFLTMRMPHRPYSRCGLSNRITERLKGLGVPLTHYGPHVFRHACATHLLEQRFSMKEIGDHLGHRSAEATRIYAKVDLRSLCEVADLHLPDFSDTTHLAESLFPQDISLGKLAVLREIADLDMGGVA